MASEEPPCGIETVVCNEDVWFLRLGTRLGWHPQELAHSTVKTSIMAVPRKEVAYWRARLAELKAGTLEHGPARALLLHESVHSRQMRGKWFWWFGLRYILSRRFRRRIEEEGYTVHLTYLAEHGITIEAPYWIEHLERLYFGAFKGKRAGEAFDRIVAAVRQKVPDARIVGQMPHT